MGKTAKCCFKMYNPGQQNTFVRLFFFEAMTILQTFLRRLGKLNSNPFTWLSIEFLNILEAWVGSFFIITHLSSLPPHVIPSLSATLAFKPKSEDDKPKNDDDKPVGFIRKTQNNQTEQ